MTQDKQILSPVGLLAIETVLESISDGVFAVDTEWRVTSFNRAAAATALVMHKTTRFKKIRMWGSMSRSGGFGNRRAAAPGTRG